MASSRAILVPPSLAAALWIFLAAAHGLLTRFGPPPADGPGQLGLLRLLVPQTVPDFAWASAAPWPVVVPALSTILLFSLASIAVGLVERGADEPTRSRHTLLLWAAIAAAGAAAAIVLTAGELLADPGLRWQLVADRMLGAVPVALTWGVVWAWIPAVIATLARPSAARSATRERTAARTATPTLTVAVIASLVAAALLVVAVPAAVAANRATIGQGMPSLLPPAPLPPAPEPTPPPEVAPVAVEPDGSWCTTAELTFAGGGGDAATGHRAGAVTATNTGGRTCVLMGYPDLAFADTAGNAVAATVTPGGSFMTEDPGPTAVDLEPGAVAVSYAGWDATDGRTTLTSVYVAPWAGATRAVITLADAWDITAPSVVFVTAWQPRPAVDPFGD